MIAANFPRTHSPSRLAWSEGWQPPGAQISRQKTALTDTVKHTQAVSSADRVQCLALLVHTVDTTYNIQLILKEIYLQCFDTVGWAAGRAFGL